MRKNKNRELKIKRSPQVAVQSKTISCSTNFSRHDGVDIDPI